MSDQAVLVDTDALRRVVAVINSKGGVLKTSVTANVAGRLAASGMRILAIDLDISGNLKLDLGLLDHPQEDGGKGLVDAIWSDAPFPVVADVRTNLDFVFGGRQLEMLGVLSRMPTAEDLPGGSVHMGFARKLAQVAEDYDLVFLDCPPGNSELQDMALAATGWVLIPTKTEQASWEGLRGVGPRVRNARKTNPGLRYLGVVITGHNPSATRVHRNTRARLEVVKDTVPVFEAVIRHSETAAHDCRARGQLAHELARDVVDSQATRLQALRRRRSGAHAADVVLPVALSGTADSLAGDYARLAAEICDRITAAETAAEEAARLDGGTGSAVLGGPDGTRSLIGQAARAAQADEAITAIDVREQPAAEVTS